MAGAFVFAPVFAELLFVPVFELFTGVGFTGVGVTGVGVGVGVTGWFWSF